MSESVTNTHAGLMAVAEMLRPTIGFASVRVQPALVLCEAAGAADAAEYRLTVDGDRLWVSLVTPARYLSQSIEQDLVHSGDKAGDLLRDELIDLGLVSDRSAPLPLVEHFRSPDRLYTFRTPIEGGSASLATPDGRERAAAFVRAYCACFGHLGGMAGE